MTNPMPHAPAKKSRLRSCLLIGGVLFLVSCVGGLGTCGGCIYIADQRNEAEARAMVAALQAALPSHPRAVEHQAVLASLVALMNADDLTMNANARLAGAYGIASSDGTLSTEEIDAIMADVAEVVAHGGDVGASGADFDWD